MSLVFLPDPLGSTGLREMLGDGTGGASPARALNHRPQPAADFARLLLGGAPGAESAGVLLPSQSPAAERACAFLAAIGGHETRVEARLDDGSSTLATAYVAAVPGTEASGCAGWSAGEIAQLGEILREFVALPPGHEPASRALVGAIAVRAAARVRGAARQVRRQLGRGFESAGDVETISVDHPYEAFFAVEEHRLRHRRFDGDMTGPVNRAVFCSGDAVTVVPFDPGLGSVLMVEQFRAGPSARRDPSPWSIEAIAGRCDGLEAPEETARREAQEEAGLVLGRLVRAAAYYPSPGIAAEFITSFVGEADLSTAGGLHGLAEEDEDIRAIVVPLEEALAAAEDGEIANAPLLVTLHWLARHRDRLARAWGDAEAAETFG